MTRSSITRRRFVAGTVGLFGVAGAVAVPWVISSCRRRAGTAPLAVDEPTLDLDVRRNARPPLPHEEPLVRVRIAQLIGNEIESTARIGEPDTWVRMINEVDDVPAGNSGDDSANDTDDTSARTHRRAPRGTILFAPITLALSSNGWSVKDARGSRPWTEGFERLSFHPATNARTGAIPVNDVPHLGTLQCTVRTRPATDQAAGAFDIVNLLPMEQYLPGVLAKELYSHWHPDTFMAQAVAARSFAWSEICHWRTRRHFDVSNTTQSQMYIGSVTLDVAHRAVRETSSLYLMYDDRAVPGYYSACCGGRAATAPDVIGPNPVNDIPPLWGREGDDVCTEASVYQWKRTRDRRAVLDRLHLYAASRKHAELVDLPALDAIDIIDVNAHGRPTRYAIIGRDVVVEMTPRELARALDFSSRSIARPNPRLYSSFLSFSMDSGTIIIEGRGLGHGAGLCQYGAEQLAQRGTPWDRILDWYYPSVALHDAGRSLG
jgi:stage II sporulation protein D